MKKGRWMNSITWWKVNEKIAIKIETKKTQKGNAAINIAISCNMTINNKVFYKGDTWYGGDYVKNTDRGFSAGMLIVRHIQGRYARIYPSYNGSK